MPNTNANSTPVLWATVASKSLNSTARFDSDELAISPDATEASISVTCDNAGTPAAGDYVECYIRWSVDGTTFDTDEHSMYLGRLDTHASNNPGEDPARRTYALNVRGKQKFKLGQIANQGGTRAITTSAVYNELRQP